MIGSTTYCKQTSKRIGLILPLLLLIGVSFFFQANAQDSWLYVGTYTEQPDGTPTGSEGIYIYKFNTNTGQLDSVGVEKISSPGYLTVVSGGHLEDTMLYAGINARTKGESELAAYRVNSKTGLIKMIDNERTYGDNVVYLSVSSDRIRLGLTHYFSPTSVCYFIYSDGTIGKRYIEKTFTGSSVNTKRQESPHPHCIEYTNTGSIVMTDLGRDALQLFNWNGEELYRIDTSCNEIPPGSGPRHFTFHPNGRYLYMVEELSGTVATFLYHKEQLILLQRLTTYNDGAGNEAGTSDVHVSPDGKFLYVSNRGTQNNIAIYSIDKRSGMLRLVGHQSTEGETPRNFTLDPTGRYLLVANQSTGNIIVFKRDEQTGMLFPTGEAMNVPQPTCLKMIVK